jgi:hypothetical protein
MVHQDRKEFGADRLRHSPSEIEEPLLLVENRLGRCLSKIWSHVPSSVGLNTELQPYSGPFPVVFATTELIIITTRLPLSLLGKLALFF